MVTLFRPPDVAGNLVRNVGFRSDPRSRDRRLGLARYAHRHRRPGRQFSAATLWPVRGTPTAPFRSHAASAIPNSEAPTAPIDRTAGHPSAPIAVNGSMAA